MFKKSIMNKNPKIYTKENIEENPEYIAIVKNIKKIEEEIKERTEKVKKICIQIDNEIKQLSIKHKKGMAITKYDLIKVLRLLLLWFETAFNFRKTDSERINLKKAKEIFGFNQDIYIDTTIIKKRYKALAWRHHPDRGWNNKKMVDLNNAKDILLRYYKNKFSNHVQDILTLE